MPLAVLADFMNVTADGKLNILGISDTFYGPSLPLEVPSIRLILLMQTEPQDRGKTFTVALKMFNNQGSSLLPHPLQRLIVPQELPARVNRPQIIELKGVSFEQFGDYFFSILVDDDQKARIPFHIVLKPAS